MGCSGFGVGVGGDVVGEGGGLLEILQAMQMDQTPLYAPQGFGIEGSSSGSGGLGDGGRINNRRRIGLWRVRHWWGKLS